MRASAIHSLLSPEHGPECVPLVKPLPNEVLETADHALHDLIFGVAIAKIQRVLEVNGVSPKCGSELRRRHEDHAGLERNRCGTTEHDCIASKKANRNA